MRRIATVWPILLVFVLGTLWGLHFSLIKICSESGLSHFGILTATSAGVAIAFVLVSALRRERPRLTLKHARFYCLCALFGYVGPILVELVVAKQMAAGILTLIVSTAPIFTLIFASLFKTDAVGPAGVFGMILGIAAITALLLPQFNNANGGTESVALRWLPLTFLVPIAYGFYHNYVAKYWPADSNVWQVATGEMTVALLLIAPLFVFYAEPIIDDGGLQPVHWAILALVVCAVIEVYLSFEIIRLSSAVTVSLSNFVTIAAGVLWGMLFFGERPTWWDWVCVIVLMFALHLVVKSRERKNSETAA